MEEGRQYRMTLEVFRAASTGDSSFFENLADSDSSTFLQVTIGKNTVLHVALQFKSIEAAKKIVTLNQRLVYETNSKGNTPLHVAARVGDSSMVKILIDKAKELDVEAGVQQQFRKMVNQNGDTALHIAVKYGNFEVVKELINENDPEELANWENEAGESALFLAVERQRYDIASHILTKASNCSYAGRDDMNILHALAFRTSNLPEVIHELTVVVKCLYISKRSSEGFVTALIEKCPSAIEKRDNSGRTPLHIAAFMGNEKFVKLLLDKGQVSNIAYSKDNKGSSALHIAAKEGKVEVMKELIKKCPDIYELLDKMGRNALHVAAESGQIDAINFFLRRPECKGLINEQDIEGNTPIHLAAFEGHIENIASKLGPNNDVDLNSTNNDGLTTMDHILLQVESGFRLTWESRVKLKDAQPSLRGLLLLREMSDNNLNDPTTKAALADKSISDSKADGMENSDTKAVRTRNSKAVHKTNTNSEGDRIAKIAKNDMLVATLITTVTFTAAFTVPGGYRSQGVDEGKAVLSKTNAIHVFQIANTLAFGLSITSVNFSYMRMTFKRDFPHKGNKIQAEIFRAYSILSLVVAFISGTYAVMPHSLGITTAVIVCCCIFSNDTMFFLYLLATITRTFLRFFKQIYNEELPLDDSEASPVQG